MLPHSDRQEFYNDFNDYSFAITAPKNYVVWATGDFLNPDAVLQSEYLKRYKVFVKKRQSHSYCDRAGNEVRKSNEAE
jgi:hypothetical protein